MKYLFFLLILFCSCSGEAITSEKQGDFDLELLFEKDGCKMYRLKDGSRRVYWSDCSGKAELKITSGGKNKTTTITEAITTANE